MARGFAKKVDARAAKGGGDFSLSVRKFAKATKADVGQVTRRVALGMLVEVVERSPVDTGRFRGNWFAGVGSPIRIATDRRDRVGASTIASGSQAIDKAEPGQIIYLSNSVPYSIRLEYGWSAQASNGIVRPTIVRFRSLFAAAVKEARA